jgi:hypothetical protein
MIRVQSEPVVGCPCFVRERMPTGYKPAQRAG